MFLFDTSMHLTTNDELSDTSTDVNTNKTVSNTNKYVTANVGLMKWLSYCKRICWP